MNPASYSLPKFLSALSSDPALKSDVDIFARERAYFIFSGDPGARQYDPDPAAYTSNLLDSWWKGEKTIVVYPNEMRLLRYFAGPLAKSLLSGNPVTLLVDLATFLVKWRKSSETVPLSEPETLLFLKVHEAGNEWTTRSQLVSDLQGMDREQFDSALSKLASAGVFEANETQVRVSGKYL